MNLLKSVLILIKKEVIKLEIYTVGHSNMTEEEFINLLKKYEINCIVDVRSFPKSKYVSHFDKENISKYLKKNNIVYIYMGKELGARRDNPSLYNDDGILDFEKVKRNQQFLNGINRIKKGLKKGYKVSLMCSEKYPQDCHRSILIGKYLKDNDFKVKHIDENGEIKSQEDIEELLMDKHFPDRNQMNLFKNKTEDETEKIQKVYALSNRKIGFKKSSENE